MDIIINLFIVGFIIILGLSAQFLFKKTKIPDVLILIIFGAILSYFNLAQGAKLGSDELTLLITFSLIYVVFYGALPINIKAFFSTMSYATLSAIMNFFIVTGIVGLLSYVIGFSWVFAFSLGALFCVLDGSIINGLLEVIKIDERAEAQIQSESAIIDTLVILAILSIINFSKMALGQVVQSLTSYLLLSFAIGFVIAIIWSFAFKHVGHYSSAPIATMALLVMMYAFSEYVNANGVITVFSFAIVLGNVNIWSKLFYKDQKKNFSVLDVTTKSFFKDISFLIRTFLFVYLGLLVDFNQWSYLIVGVAFFGIALISRSYIGKWVQNKNFSLKDQYYIDAMCAKGLTPTVLLAVIRGSSAFGNIVIGGIFSSVLVSSFLIFLIDKDYFTTIHEYISNNTLKSKTKKTKKK